jgi:hypothetical protein
MKSLVSTARRLAFQRGQDGGPRASRLIGALAAAVGTLYAHTATAADGCLILLCLAAPSWRSIPQCVPPVTQLFRDLARGRPFPACAIAGAGNAATHQWALAPSNCPPQYVTVIDGPSGPIYRCAYSGCISVNVDGVAFTRTWWSLSGDSVTQFTDAAKARLGRWDNRFDDDYAVWLASEPSLVRPD